LPSAIVVTSTLLLLSAPVRSQQIIEPTIHWAYSSFFGTGWYKLNDERSAYVLSAAPRWDLGDARFNAEGDRKIAYTIRLPATVGVASLDFDDIPGIIDPDNFTVGSVGVGLDADIPVTSRFSLRPNAQLSYGRIFGESESAWIYGAEFKGRYTFGSGQLDWAILARLGLAGYTSNLSESDDFVYAAVGAEFGYPVSWFGDRNHQTMLYWHLGFTDFIDEVRFPLGIDEFDSVANYWQIGAAIGRREKPLRVWFMEFDRFGLAYNYSTSGELRGIKLVFRSLYDL